MREAKSSPPFVGNLDPFSHHTQKKGRLIRPSVVGNFQVSLININPKDELGRDKGRERKKWEEIGGMRSREGEIRGEK